MASFFNFIYQKSDNKLEQTEKIRFVLALLFVFSLPYDRFYSSLILIVFTLLTLIDFRKVKIKTIPKQLWLFQIPYLLSIVGYFYSYNKAEAGFILERQLAIIIFPLLLPLAIDINEQRKKWLLSSLVISCVIAICYLFFNIFFVIYSGHFPLNYILSSQFFNHQFSAPLAIHAGYLSLFVSLSVLYCIQQIVKSPTLTLKILYAICTSILFLGLLFLASRNTILSTILISTIIFPLFYIKRKLLFIGISSLLFIGSFFLLSKVNYLKERFASHLMNDIVVTKNTPYNLDGVEPRVERWLCALELIAKSPMIGYGTGDEITMLKTKYVEKKYFISYVESFNAHNEYLSYLIKNGVIGFVFFMLAFIYFLYLAIKNKDYIYTSFLIILLIGFLTENSLDANKGILFFAFFNTFFGYCILINRKSAE